MINGDGEGVEQPCDFISEKVEVYRVNSKPSLYIKEVNIKGGSSHSSPYGHLKVVGFSRDTPQDSSQRPSA